MRIKSKRSLKPSKRYKMHDSSIQDDSKMVTFMSYVISYNY